MAFRHKKEAQAEGPRWLELDASMTGTLTFKDPVHLQINGQFEGTLDVKGNLSIGEKASVKATIRGETITIGGAVNGNVTASDRVEFLGSARVSGTIVSPRIVIQDGAVFNGRIEMTGRQAAAPWMNAEELARFLEVDLATVAQWAKEGRLPALREGDEWRFERAKIEAWLAQEKIK